MTTYIDVAKNDRYALEKNSNHQELKVEQFEAVITELRWDQNEFYQSLLLTEDLPGVANFLVDKSDEISRSGVRIGRAVARKIGKFVQVSLRRSTSDFRGVRTCLPAAGSAWAGWAAGAGWAGTCWSCCGCGGCGWTSCGCCCCCGAWKPKGSRYR